MQKERIKSFWVCMDKQKWTELADYFSPSATIHWPNTGEVFDVQSFVLVNSQYPGNWRIGIERIEKMGDLIVTVVKVSDENQSLHATSFFEMDGDSIIKLQEYWGEDGPPPEWRRKLKLNLP